MFLMVLFDLLLFFVLVDRLLNLILLGLLVVELDFVEVFGLLLVELVMFFNLELFFDGVFLEIDDLLFDVVLEFIYELLGMLLFLVFVQQLGVFCYV